jgi:hypothetical protein
MKASTTEAALDQLELLLKSTNTLTTTAMLRPHSTPTGDKYHI